MRNQDCSYYIPFGSQLQNKYLLLLIICKKQLQTEYKPL